MQGGLGWGAASKRDRHSVDGGAEGGAPARAAGPSVESELEGDEGDIHNWSAPYKISYMENPSEAMNTEALQMLMREQAEAEHGYGTPAYYTACSY